VLFLRAVASVLSDGEEFRVAGAVLIGGVGPVRDRISLSCDVGGVGNLTGRLSHALGGGVIFTVGVMAEAGMLEGMLVFGTMYIRLGRSVETDSLSVDDFGVGWWAREDLVGEVELERSQFTTF